MKIAVGFFIIATAAAQTIVPPEDAAKLLSAKGEEPLQCQVAPLQPVLDFSFRFQAGYSVRIPLDQYKAGKHQWVVVTRIAANGGAAPVYFFERLQFTTAVKMDGAGEAGGGFALGAGRYRAEFDLMDDQARVCHAAWNIEAKTASQEATRMMIKPGAVKEISQLEVQPPERQPGTKLGRLTVLLHAVPVAPKSTKLSAEDTVVLLGSLGSLLESVPAKSVRLVVFNLDQQQEIYRQDNFTQQQLADVHQAFFNLQLGTVDVHKLSAKGPQEFLEQLVGTELAARDRADEIVFLGSHSRLTTKPAFTSGKRGPSMPKLVYVQYAPPKRLSVNTLSRDEFASMGHGTAIDRSRDTRTNYDQGGSGIYVIPDRKEIDALSTPAFQAPRDIIDYLVQELKGRTVIVSTPLEFAKAVSERVKN